VQIRVSEGADPESNIPTRFAQGFRVYKMLFKMGSVFDDGEQGPVFGHIFQGTASGRAPCQEDKLQTFISWQ
jgi:hypothetical protein